MEAILGNQVMFVIFSAMIITFSILTVTSKRILRAATFLLFVLLATAGLYFMLNYQFLAAVQITLYAGGIVVLIIFSILLTSHIDHKFDPVPARKLIMGVIAAGSGIVVTLITLLSYDFVPSGQEPIVVDMKTIGNSLLSYGDNGYVLPFEVISVLLLAAMIAAIVIAKRKKV
jgi:NADH-quinone oxidoreductase subunit J